jgi:hypothetical protein
MIRRVRAIHVTLLAAALSLAAAAVALAAPPPPSTPAPVIGGHAARLVEPLLAIRLIEVRELAMLHGELYGAHHPVLTATLTRLRVLEEAAATAPPPTGEPSLELRARVLQARAALRARATGAAQEHARLAASLGPAHPRLRAAAERKRRYQELVEALDRHLPDSLRAPLPLSSVAGRLAERAAVEGRMRFLRLRYGESHPRLRELAARLGALPASGAATCDERRSAALLLHDLVLAGVPPLESVERDFALDALVAHLARAAVCPAVVAQPQRRRAR